MLLMFSGPSTVGKDARWLKSAEELGFLRIVPYTTRARRKNEVDGYDYHFISKRDFYDLLIDNKLAQWDFILGEYYGFPVILREKADSKQDICIQVRATMGLRLRQDCPGSKLVMLMASDEATIENRLRERGYSDEDVRSRLRHSFEEMAQAPLFDLIIPDADILSHLDALRILRDYLSSR